MAKSTMPNRSYAAHGERNAIIIFLAVVVILIGAALCSQWAINSIAQFI